MSKSNVSLYEINISDILGSSEYIGMIDDLVRFWSIQIMIQIMLMLMDPDNYMLFSSDLFILLLFITIGVMFYWLVFKKLVSFV